MHTTRHTSAQPAGHHQRAAGPRVRKVTERSEENQGAKLKEERPTRRSPAACSRRSLSLRVQHARRRGGDAPPLPVKARTPARRSDCPLENPKGTKVQDWGGWGSAAEPSQHHVQTSIQNKGLSNYSGTIKSEKVQDLSAPRHNGSAFVTVPKRDEEGGVQSLVWSRRKHGTLTHRWTALSSATPLPRPLGRGALGVEGRGRVEVGCPWLEGPPQGRQTHQDDRRGLASPARVDTGTGTHQEVRLILWLMHHCAHSHLRACIPTSGPGTGRCCSPFSWYLWAQLLLVPQGKVSPLPPWRSPRSSPKVAPPQPVPVPLPVCPRVLLLGTWPPGHLLPSPAVRPSCWP